jgi:glucosamine--fructose-6-phosphate aminotransferase (isomerizing)
VVVALSTSGRTPEIVTVCRRLREAGAVTVAVVNDTAGPLGEAADVVIAVGAGAGAEQAVPRELAERPAAMGAPMARCAPSPAAGPPGRGPDAPPGLTKVAETH